MSNITCPYIAFYGSLRPGHEHKPLPFMRAAEDMIDAYGEYVTAGAVHGKLYIVGDLPLLTDPDNMDTGLVSVDVFKFPNNPRMVLYHFDHLRDAPKIFRRKKVTLYGGVGTMDTWIYYYEGDLPGRHRSPSGDYLVETGTYEPPPHEHMSTSGRVH